MTELADIMAERKAEEAKVSKELSDRAKAEQKTRAKELKRLQREAYESEKS